MSTTYNIGRKAGSGQFCTVKYANSHKSTTVVETIKRK